MLLVLAGLPEPEVNVLVGSENGTKREHDLVYRAAKLGLEYDGRQHADDPVQWRVDIQRREDSDDDGWRILVVVSSGIYVDPGATLEKVWRVLRERGQPGLPPRLSDDWRPHLPGRGVRVRRTAKCGLPRATVGHAGQSQREVTLRR